jgi:hypothetical protein
MSSSATKGAAAAGRQKLHVFVSSVVEEFAEYRAAARKGIEAAGAKPVMVNEDSPSQGTSSRNACLDAIDSSDLLVSIVGKRGGWTTPSGRLVVEEEFEHARVRNLPVLAFIQEAERDTEADRFVRRLSDYVDGMFRTKFHAPADLQQAVERAVRERSETMSPRDIEGRDLSPYFLPQRRSSGIATTLRLVLEPERQEEVIDPVRIASGEFRERLLELGHTKDVRLFSYLRAKSAEVQGSALVIEQDESTGRHGGGAYVRLELAESGRVILDGSVAGRSGRGGVLDTPWDAFVVDVKNVEDVLSSFLRFSAVLYAEIDRYHRHERFFYNVGLLGLGHRILERNPRPRHSYGISMRNSDAAPAFPTSRALSRAALANSGTEEIERVIVLLERAARD